MCLPASRAALVPVLLIRDAGQHSCGNPRCVILLLGQYFVDRLSRSYTVTRVAALTVNKVPKGSRSRVKVLTHAGVQMGKWAAQ